MLDWLIINQNFNIIKNFFYNYKNDRYMIPKLAWLSIRFNQSILFILIKFNENNIIFNLYYSFQFLSFIYFLFLYNYNLKFNIKTDHINSWVDCSKKWFLKLYFKKSTQQINYDNLGLYILNSIIKFTQK